MSTYFPKVRNNSHSFLQVQKNAHLLSESPEKIHPRVFICNKYTEIIR